MSEPPTITKLRSLASLAPPTIQEQEQSLGFRVRYLAGNNGTGLQLSRPLYQVLHVCGEWAWAEGKYCQHCGQPVELTEEQASVCHPQKAPAPVRPPVPPPRDPPGSFNNPLPGQMTPARPLAAPGVARQDFSSDQAAQLAADRIMGLVKAPGVIVAQMPDEGVSRLGAKLPPPSPPPVQDSSPPQGEQADQQSSAWIAGADFDDSLDQEIQEYG